MKGTFKKIWYTFSVILIIAGMVLVLPGAMYGGDDSSQTTASSADSTMTTTAAETTTTASAEATTTVTAEDATSTTVDAESTTTIAPEETSTTVAAETATTAASEDTATTVAADNGSVTLIRTSNGAAITANFYIKDADGKYYTSTGVAVSKEDVLAKQSLSSDGTFIWSGLPLKTYTIETEPVSGYSFIISPASFTIDTDNANQAVTLDISSIISETTTNTVPETTTATGSVETTTTTIPEETTTSTAPEETTTTTVPEETSTTAAVEETTTTTAPEETTTTTVNVAEEIYSASLNVVANPQTVKPGEKVAFKIIVSNTGNMPLSNINVIDKLPNVVIFNSADGLAYDDISREVSFTIANLNPGEIYQKEIVAAIPIVAADSLILTNTVNISGEKIISVQKTVDINLSVSAETDLTVLGIESYNPFIYTDKDDYQPGGKVTIFGEGFVPGENVQVIFYAISAAIPEGKIEHVTVINNVSTDGTFVYGYNIIGAAEYRVEARSIVEDENGSATTLKSGTTEINVEENALDPLLGSLLTLTSFTDCDPNDVEIQVKKYVLNADGTDYTDRTTSFTIKVKRNDTGTIYSANLKDNESHLFVFSNSATNNYTITEENIASGYTFGYFTVGSSSTRYSNGATISCNPGSIIYVNMYNYKAPQYGSVTIIKKVDGGVPTEGSFSFYYTIDGGDHIPFTLNAANNWTITLSVIVGKSYVIVEDDPGPNWILPTITKISGDITFNIDESTRSVSFIPNCDGTIVYNNSQKSFGSIVVDKTVANGLTSGVFTFNISKVGDATWTYAGTPVVITYPGNTGNKTFTDLDLNATYLVTETSSGTNIPFTSASVPADGLIALTTTAPGTISFTNTGSKGSIVVDKTVANGLTSGVFTFNISKVGDATWTYAGTPVVITYPGNTGNKTFTDLDLNATYLVTETSSGTNIPFTSASVPADGLIALTTTAPGTISFTNTGSKGSIVVDKTVANGLTSGVFTFNISKVGDATWTYAGTPVVITYPGNTGNKTFTDLDLNATYLVTETSSGTNIPFTSASVPADGLIALTTTAPGTISFTNTGSKGSIVVDKTVANGLTSGVFTFNISKVGDATWTYAGTPVVITYPGNTGNKTFTDLDLNATYLVTETSSGTNIPFTSASVPADGLIALTTTAPGTISFTNTGSKGSIVVDKTVANGLTSGVFTFNISKVGDATWTYAGTPVVITYPGNTGNKTFTDLDLNATYLVTETSSGTNIPFTSASVPADGLIALTTTAPGTISFTNTGIKGSIHITKSLIGGLVGGIYTFSITADDSSSTWTHPDVTINLDDADTTNDSVLITEVPFGSYTVTENIPAGATYHVTIPSNGILTASPSAENPDVIAAFTNGSNSYSVSVQKATIGTGFSGSFTFELQRVELVNGETIYNTISTLAISTSGGNAAFPINESNPITAGTYRVVETGRGGAAYTDVSNSGIPAGSAVNNMTSPIFVLNEGNTSQTVYFVNSIPGPSNGSIMIVKNVTVTQGAETTFTFTIIPAVNGVSSYNVIVPANQSTSTFTINGVPFGVKYSISEDSLPGWFLQSSEGLTFTLNAAATLATPVFTNTPTGGGTTTTTGITVAGLSTGGIEVLGIQELPFTGSRDTLFKFGIVFIIFGLMMMILLPIALRSGKHLRTR